MKKSIITQHAANCVHVQRTPYTMINSQLKVEREKQQWIGFSYFLHQIISHYSSKECDAAIVFWLRRLNTECYTSLSQKYCFLWGKTDFKQFAKLTNFIVYTTE